MTTSSVKSEQINSFLDYVSNKAFGCTRTGSIKANACVACGKPAMQFKDSASKREYTISGLCQECQEPAKMSKSS